MRYEIEIFEGNSLDAQNVGIYNTQFDIYSHSFQVGKEYTIFIRKSKDSNDLFAYKNPFVRLFHHLSAFNYEICKSRFGLKESIFVIKININREELKIDNSVPYNNLSNPLLNLRSSLLQSLFLFSPNGESAKDELLDISLLFLNCLSINRLDGVIFLEKCYMPKLIMSSGEQILTETQRNINPSLTYIKAMGCYYYDIYCPNVNNYKKLLSEVYKSHCEFKDNKVINFDYEIFKENIGSKDDNKIPVHLIALCDDYMKEFFEFYFKPFICDNYECLSKIVLYHEIGHLAFKPFRDRDTKPSLQLDEYRANFFASVLTKGIYDNEINSMMDMLPKAYRKPYLYKYILDDTKKAFKYITEEIYGVKL